MSTTPSLAKNRSASETSSAKKIATPTIGHRTALEFAAAHADEVETFIPT